MGLKKTLIAAVIFVAVLGLYLWDYGRVSRKTAYEEQQKRLVPLPEQPVKDEEKTPGPPTPKLEVSAIAIERHDGKIELRKDGAHWQLTQPIAARASDSAVDQLVSHIEQAQRNEPFDASDDKLAEFGLAQPAAKVEISAPAKNYSAQFELGADTPDGTQVYARSGGKSQVFTVPASLLAQMTKPVSELRDKRLVPADLSNAISFEIDDNGQKLAANKQGDDWTLTAPEKLKGDADQIRQFLGGLNSVEAKDFLDSPTLNLAALGLDPPRWQGRFTVVDEGTTRTLELLAGDPATSGTTDLYAKTDADKYVMISNEMIADRIHPTVTTLRNKALFTLKPADVGWITLSVRGTPLYIERASSGLWRIHGEPDTPVDQAKVSQMLTQLLALEATKFFKPGETPGTEQMGLVRPTLLARVANRDRTTTESIETGSKAEGEDFVWGRVINTDQVIGIDWTRPGAFFLTRDDIIERNLFSFDEGAARRMTISQDGKATLTLERQPGGGWLASAAGKTGTRQIDAVRITAILDALAGLRWENRLDPQNVSDKVLIETQKLNNPSRRIEIYAAEGKPLGSLGQAGETDKLTYVRTQSGYYAVDKMRMQTMTEAMNSLMTQMQ